MYLCPVRTGRRHHIAVVVTFGAVVVAAGCEDDGQDGGGEAVAPATSATAAPASTSSVPTEPEEVEDLESIVAVVEAGFGETDDVFAALRPLTLFPEGMPVPPDAVATDVYFLARAGLRDEVEASVSVWTPAAPDDVATLYRTALPAMGYEHSGGTDPAEHDRTQLLDFANPSTGASFSMNSFDVTAAVEDERMTSPETGTSLHIGHKFPGADEAVERLGRWAAADLPVVVQAVASVGVMSDFEPRDALRVAVTLRVAGEPDAVLAAIEQDLAGVEPLAGYPYDKDDVGIVGTAQAGYRASYAAEPADEVGASDVTVMTCIPFRVGPADRRLMSPYLHRSSCEESSGLVTPRPVEETPPEPVGLTPITGQPATVPELVDATKAALGPTDDVVADLAAFAVVPKDVPTPHGAQIERFDLQIDRTDPQIATNVNIHASAPGSIADLATFFEAKLAAAGYLHMQTTIENDGMPTEQRAVSFTNDDGGVDDVAEITVFVGDAYADPATPSEGTPIWYMISEVVQQGELAGHAWALPLAGIDAEAVRSWRIEASAEPLLTTKRQQLKLSATYDVVDPVATVEGIRADPPDGVTIGEDFDEDISVWLEHPAFDSWWVRPTTDLLNEGIGSVDVIGWVPFELAG